MPKRDFAAELRGIHDDLKRELEWLAAPGAPRRDSETRTAEARRVCARAAERAGALLLAAVAAGRLPDGPWLDSMRLAGYDDPAARPDLVFAGAVQRLAAVPRDPESKLPPIPGLLADEPGFDFARDLRLGGFTAAYPRALAILAARLERAQRRPRPRDPETIRPELRPLARQRPGAKCKVFPPGVEAAAIAWLDEPHQYSEIAAFVADRKRAGTLPKSTPPASVRNAVRTIGQRRRDAAERADAAR